MVKYEYATYKAVFDSVKLYSVKDYRNKEEKQNLILVGIKGNLNINYEKYNEYIKLLSNEITDFHTDKNIVTDDFAPVGN